MSESVEITYKYLLRKYNRTVIGKREVAHELAISLGTLDNYMAKGIGLPPYKKLGTAKNARVFFNIIDVAVFINSDRIETM